MTLFLIFTQQVWHKFDYDVRQNFSVRISWHMVFEIPASSATLQTNDDWDKTLYKLFECFLHFLMLKVVLNIHCPQLKFGHLKNVCTTRVCVLLMSLSPNVCFNILKVSEMFSLILKQNFTQTFCSFLIPEKFAEQAR
jgi:hypothetical protein